MHACVHDWTLAALNEEIEPAWYWYAFDCVTTEIRMLEYDEVGRPQHAWLVPHTARLLSTRFCHGQMTGELSSERCIPAFAVAVFLWKHSHPAAGERICRRTLRGFKKASTQDSGHLLAAVHRLGMVYKAQGKLKEADEMYLRALQGYESELGAGHIYTAAVMWNMGGLYMNLNKLEEAEELLLRAMQICETTLGVDHGYSLTTLTSLGTLYTQQKKMGKAEAMFLHALQKCEKARNQN
jgi:tetratricopeptide (TPR) repeat protein